MNAIHELVLQSHCFLWLQRLQWTSFMEFQKLETPKNRQHTHQIPSNRVPPSPSFQAEIRGPLERPDFSVHLLSALFSKFSFSQSRKPSMLFRICHFWSTPNSYYIHTVRLQFSGALECHFGKSLFSKIFWIITPNVYRKLSRASPHSLCDYFTHLHNHSDNWKNLLWSKMVITAGILFSSQWTWTFIPQYFPLWSFFFSSFTQQMFGLKDLRKHIQIIFWLGEIADLLSDCPKWVWCADKPLGHFFKWTWEEKLILLIQELFRRFHSFLKLAKSKYKQSLYAVCGFSKKKPWAKAYLLH